MKKFENTLIISDVDGTLVDETWKISKENIDAARYFMENGGIFTYATGRQTPIAKEIVRQLEPNAPVICYNGAAIYDYSNQKYLWTSELNPSVEIIIDDVLANCDVVNIEINTETGIYTLKDIDKTVRRYEKFLPFFTMTDSAKSVAYPWFKLVIVVNESNMPALRKYIASKPYFKDFQFSQSAPFLYEILNPGVNKGSALLQLKKIIGDGYKIISLGDNENDIDLIKAADFGFAVATATPLLMAETKNIAAGLYDHALADIVNKIENNLI